MSNIIKDRQHAILSERKTQLANNILAFKGGKKYVHTRLWRSPNESDRSWNGNTAAGLPGRKDRAYLINDAGRIVAKINDYLFSRECVRNGIDAAWAKGSGVPDQRRGPDRRQDQRLPVFPRVCP